MLLDMANQPPTYTVPKDLVIRDDITRKPITRHEPLKGTVLPSDADYDVKSWPPFFSKMITGQKKHDMRKKSDRAYRIGDKVLLREYDPFGGGYTGRSAIFEITYITSNDTPCALSSNALNADAVILSLDMISQVFVDA